MTSHQERLSAFLAILSSGEFDGFLNHVEDATFECKRAPYRLDEETLHFELAKDVAAFANSGGGLLVIGLETVKVLEKATDTIVKVRPFPRERFNAQRHRDIITAHIFPQIEALHLEWYPARDDPTSGLAVISVPPQSAVSQPFLASKFVDHDGKVRGFALGYFERHRDTVTRKDARELHYLMRAGRMQNEIASRLEAIEQKLSSSVVDSEFAAPAPYTDSALALFETIPSPPADRIGSALSVAGLEGRPAYVLRTHHLGVVSIPGIFSTQRPPVRQLLESPPELRAGGFGIDAGSSASMVEGKLWRTLDAPSHRMLELWRDGMLIFAAPADETFLCWGRKPPPPLVINPIALLESLVQFCDFARLVQQHTEPKNCGVQLEVEFRGMTGDQRPSLAPGAVGSAGWIFADSRHASPGPVASFAARWVQGEIDPGRLAFDVATGIYEWFGLTHDRIPYATGEGDQRRIDIELLKSL